MSLRVAVAAVLLNAVLASRTTAQIPANALDPATLRRMSFSWTQPELEYGFAHWDAVFSGRVVPRGERVHKLALGRPLAAFAAGTPGAEALEKYIANEKVAGLLILQNGAIRLERYALGHGAAGRWVSQSVAKSITSTLVGAAMKDGFITSLDDPVTKYIDGLRGSAYDSVNVRQLLTMTSGVKWTENYTDASTDISRFYIAPVTLGMSATVSYMRRLPREAPPGQKWLYKTGETHLLGVLVSSATKQTLSDYLSAKIWAPYGMEQLAVWGTDRTQDELGGCCFSASLRDYARFGQFVLDNGVIDGRSIVPDGWFENATKRQFATTYAERGYGYQWWTFDDGTFAAIGIHGQFLLIDRARKMVIAINSAWPEATSPQRNATRAAFLKMLDAVMDAEGGK